MINIKALLSYFFIIGIAILYTLFLDATGGSYLITALISAAVISVILCFYTARKLKVQIEISGDILNRNDNVTVSVVVTNEGLLPTAFMTAELFSSYHFSTTSPQKIRTSVFGKGSARFSADYRAVFFGKGKVGMIGVAATDFLGLVTLPINIPRSSAEIKVYPDIPEVNSRDGLARSLTDAAAFDESEETTQSLFAVNGTPGYEHRKYEMGDSLKLINWKVSAKRGELYVRRLEGASGAEYTFVLDKAGSRAGDEYRKHTEEQLTVEALLALMMQFAKTELPSKVKIRFDREWETIPIVTPSDVSDIRYRLTDYTFSGDEVSRLPRESENHSVVLTARCDAYISGLVSGYENRSAASPDSPPGAENIWTITRDEEDIRFVR